MRISEFGESDLIVTYFTPQEGRLKGIAKGARRSRRRFPNCLDLFCLANIEYESKRKGGLFFLHSCKLINAFPQLRSDYFSLSLASYMVELTEILFPQGVVDERVFELLRKSLSSLDTGGEATVFRILFEAKAMAVGGYGINFSKCSGCGRVYSGEGRAVFSKEKGCISCLRCQRESSTSPGLSPLSVRALSVAQSGSWEDMLGLEITEEMVKEINPAMKLHIEYRLGRKLKTAKYLE